jgi:hypothetical protein
MNMKTVKNITAIALLVCLTSCKACGDHNKKATCAEAVQKFGTADGEWACAQVVVEGDHLQFWCVNDKIQGVGTCVSDDEGEIHCVAAALRR